MLSIVCIFVLLLEPGQPNHFNLSKNTGICRARHASTDVFKQQQLLPVWSERMRLIRRGDCVDLHNHFIRRGDCVDLHNHF
jgi:hypothetical protein